MKKLRILFLLLIWAGTHSSVAGNWELLSVFYRPFRDTKVQAWGRDWNVFQSNGKMLRPWIDCQWMENCSTTFEIYLVNRHSTPVQIKDILLDGKKIADCYRVTGNVIWHRVEPATVMPGQVVSLLIKFWYTPAKKFELTFLTGNGRDFRYTVDFSDLHCNGLISRVTVDPDMDKIHLWLHGGSPVSRILLDGRDYTSKSRIGKIYGNFIPVTVNVGEKLRKGSLHNIYVGRKDIGSAVTFRAFSNDFRIGIYNAPIGCGVKYHHFDDIWNIHQQRLEFVKNAGNEDLGIIASIPDGQLKNYAAQPNMTANYLPDEPDAGEVSKFKHIRWQGQRLGMLAPQVNSKANECIRHAAHLPNMLVLDKTNRPANFFAYGRMADFTAVDYYCISSDLQPLTCYPTARVSRIAAEPLPSWMVLGCFSRPDSSKWKRYPNPAEMRLMAWSSIAGGATSISYWMYPDGKKTRGPQSNPELWNSMGKLNGEMKIAGALIAKSFPVDSSVVQVPETVIASVLRSADDEATILILLNKNCRSDAGGMSVPEITGLPVRLQLPPAIRAAGLYRLSASGMEKCRFTAENSSISFLIPDVAECAVFAVFHSAAAAEKLQRIYQQDIVPGNKTADQILHGKLSLPEAGFKEFVLRYPAAEKIAPEVTGSAVAVDINASVLDYPQGQNFLQAGENPAEICWTLPEEPGCAFLQYSVGEITSAEIIYPDGTRQMLLLPADRRIAGLKHDGKKARLKLSLPAGGSAGKFLAFAKAENAADSWIPLPVRCTSSGDEPFSPEKADTLTDGDLLKGPRWSNSKNRLQNKKISITVEPAGDAAWRRLTVCGHYNRMYGIRELGGTVFFADGSQMPLVPQKSFSGGRANGYRKYLLYWELPGKTVKKVVLNPVPANHFWLYFGEVIVLGETASSGIKGEK